MRTLRAVVEVKRQGGFSQAAKVVLATPSTVIKAVSSSKMKFVLLGRVGHRSTLTAAGEIGYRRALRILAEQNDFMSKLKRGLLRLGCLDGRSTFFALLFATYRSSLPAWDGFLRKMVAEQRHHPGLRSLLFVKRKIELADSDDVVPRSLSSLCIKGLANARARAALRLIEL